jgi:hypothetical protein
MTIYISPDAPLEATLDSVYTGLVGQVRISIIDTPNGVTYLEPTTQNIFEVPPHSGIYSWTGRSPSVPGQYTIYWDTGEPIEGPEMIAVEDLLVEGIAPVGRAQLTEPRDNIRVANMKDVGTPNVPQDIRRMRRQVGDSLRRYGHSVVHRHMYTLDDVESGIAKKCPACFDDAYSQVRNDCPVCYSIGFVSVENSKDTWIDSAGNLRGEETPLIAPRYGGFARPTLTRIIQPDVPIDIFKINERGVLTRIQNANAYTYWNPAFQDNDLIIMVSVSVDGFSITDIGDYYQTKMATANTIRGWGKKTRNQKEYTVSYQFEMALVPPNNILHSVRPGTVSYGVM